NMLDEKRLAAAAGGNSSTRPDAQAVRDATGFPIGGVPPFGHSTPLPVYVDRDLLQYDVVWAAAGTPHVNFAIAPDALVKATAGAVCDLRRD
ncbi:MAG: YbaK/EbsC family protein, partial [Actinobacteria bacterium]|nr:YbaK/EbsC family protein [Actinomycetota bacterium]MBV9935606.1 YbaK/EbsC family protein [Actinomycetota bacterium]